MATVEVLAKLTVDDLVVAVEKLPTRELTRFVRRVIAIQARRGVPLLVDEEEKTLLEAVRSRPLAGDAQGKLKTVLPLIQWLRLLPPVVAALALTTLEGVINKNTIALASQCYNEPEWEFDFIRALGGWNPEYEHTSKDIEFLMSELYDDMIRMEIIEGALS